MSKHTLPAGGSPESSLTLSAAQVQGRRGYRYMLLDVFTATPFAGNPLAVFPDAAALTDIQMAQLAKELNLSESVFITTRLPGRVALRIFTPSGELPFAGHPSVGTAWLIRALGWHDPATPLILAEGVGDVPIRFAGTQAWLTTAQPLDVSEDSLSIEQAAEILGLSRAQIATRPVRASCGIPYQLIELADLDSLASVQVESGTLARALPAPAERNLYLYVRNTSQQLRARMFTAETTLYEDPATGSAAAPLIGHLSRQMPATQMLDWQVTQGVEMGRPSHIHGRVSRAEVVQETIQIGGEAIIAGEGVLYV
ncbi:PhzF family phenazine biosynthesis protein [Salinicola endophyticus]|uniref:PhzF family phenazine biosynthesis protein n=1 Tax=Salinicola endophyticus TaxID=1949083 RepID=A0ABY8FEB5_9GAMM|nr:PhzF family phenazine biosynthesis protein [Salinicola endophyticus]WFF41147.1 PhzF family phenazine biosynthesis protein [Salinicola endophyticus]